MPSNSSSTSSSAAAAAAAAKAAAAARAAQQHLQQIHNEDASKHFAEAIAGVIVLFTIFHWIRVLYARYASKGIKDSKVMRAQVSLGRIARRILLKRVPGFTTTGHTFLVAAYIGINVALTFTNIDWSNLIGISKRLGWLAITNAAFIVFLALKNTPLAYISGYSYERLNILHQVGGYTTVTYATLHTVIMCIGFSKLHFKSVLLEYNQKMGMIAMCSFFTMFLFAVFVRRFSYEIFYISHICGFIIAMIAFGLHRPDIVDKALIIGIFASSIWFSDRIIRASRILYFSLGNTATITALPHGGTRIVLRRSPGRAVAGSHCFLWVPKIRAFETHPFTLVSRTPTSLELVIAAYDGFTQDLHNYAVQNPGAVLRASIDGPYGNVPNFAKTADKAIFVAGGSGASFTFGVAIEMVRKWGEGSNKTIDFIWAVRTRENLTWFAKELAELQSSPLVHIFLHITGPTYDSSSSLPSQTQSSPPNEKAALEGIDIAPSPRSPSSSSDQEKKGETADYDIEKGETKKETGRSGPWSSTTSLNSDLLEGKPEVERYVKEIIAGARREERVAVVGCGPEGMMWAVRRAAGGSVRVGGPSVELHCEQFGW